MMSIKVLVTLFAFMFLQGDDRKFVASVDNESKDAKILSSSLGKHEDADGELAFDLRLSELEPFEDQLAGHVYESDEKQQQKLVLMKDKNGNLLKPYPTENEIAFYENLIRNQDTVVQEMREYVPKYYGVKRVLVNEEDKVIVRYLHLENIMKDYEKACSMHVKLGLKRIPPGAPARTAEQEERYIKTMREWGFGIPGYSFYKMDGEQVREGKEYGYVMTPAQAIAAIFSFAQGKLGPKKCNLAIDMIQQLQRIEELYAKQDEFEFYDSSVLITYDAKIFVDQGKKYKDFSEAVAHFDCEGVNVPVRVRMLDFGKAVNVKHLPVEQREDPESYLRGITNLILLLQYMDLQLASSVAAPDE